MIVGLGNPGRSYLHTRHNIGLRVIRKIVGDAGGNLKKAGLLSKFRKAAVDWEKEKIIAVEPLTYINVSGPAVVQALKKFGISLENLLVICDDINLQFGTLRIRSKGSSGGHKGLKSIIENLLTENFPRLRIGIGKPSGDTAEYVLSLFSAQEEEILEKVVIPKAVYAVRLWAEQGIDRAMAEIN